ncbi:MAG: hypothetical protein HOW73_26470 [Polyangiaceae bacterium]|nr:hypothetical protein [Polyangiaceae bacterium]
MLKPTIFAIASAALLTAVACGDSKKEPDTSDNVDVQATATATATTPPAETATPAPTETAAPTASAPPKPKGPGKTAAFIASNPKSAKPGTKVATALKPEDEAALRAKLDAAVEKEGEGTAFDGSPVAGRFKQGEVIELTVTIQPNKCYTVVAVSNDGITELDASVIVAAPIPGVPAQTVANDSTTGPDSTLGGGGNCVKSPIPTAAPATVQVKATKGGGTAAVQVLSK